MAGNEDPGLEWRLVVFHRKPSGDLKTHIMYSFTEDEHFRADHEFANIGVYTGATTPDVLFPENVVCSKCFWPSKKEMEDLGAGDQYDSLLTRYMGRLGMEKNTLRRHVGPKSETLLTFRTESERAAALKEFFGIAIPKEDLKYIRGRPPALEDE